MEYNKDWNFLQQALYWDQGGDWKKAHDLVDGTDGRPAAHLHAYLHRKEGDDWNARYWYRQANEPVFEGTLDEEWTSLWNRYRS